MRKPKIGSIIRTAWYVYRINFKTYYSLALIGTVWLIVPIYGWAKYTTMMGLLTRLTYNNLVSSSESVTETKRNTKQRMWSFLYLGFRANFVLFFDLFTKTLFLFLQLIAISIAGLGVVGSIAAIFRLPSTQTYSIAISLVFILIIAWCGAVYYYGYRVTSQLHLYELPFAVKTNIKIVRSISFAKQLAEEYIFQIYIISSVFGIAFTIFIFYTGKAIFFLEEAINLPVEMLFNSIANFFVIYIYIIFASCWWFFSVVGIFSIWLGAIFVPFPSNMFILIPLCVFSENGINIFSMLYLAIAALFIPFWQSIKAVIYYRLTLRNEFIASQRNVLS